jgi:hypothetical protein
MRRVITFLNDPAQAGARRLFLGAAYGRFPVFHQFHPWFVYPRINIPNVRPEAIQAALERAANRVAQLNNHPEVLNLDPMDPFAAGFLLGGAVVFLVTLMFYEIRYGSGHRE